MEDIDITNDVNGDTHSKPWKAVVMVQQQALFVNSD
jgi:hypothetical protein